MIVLLPGYLAVAPTPGAPMINNPFPYRTRLYLIWSSMWDALRPWARRAFSWLLLLCWLGGAGYAEAAFDGSPCPAGKTVINGTSANDIIIGTGGANCIDGRAGNDRISGGGGADWIDGGSGRDELTGASSADVFFVDCGTIAPVPGNSVFDTVMNYRKVQGDIVQVPGKPTNWIVAIPSPSSGLSFSDKVVTYYTPGCPGGIGLFVLKSHSSTARSSVDVR